MTTLPTGSAATQVRAALTAIAAGHPVIVIRDAGVESDGNLMAAAALATTETVAFMVRHTSGFLCVALPEETCERLMLPVMPSANGDSGGPDYCVATDLLDNGTGISAMARARTIAALGNPTTRASDLIRPGHVVPVRARGGHAEAGVDLARLAGVNPAVAFAGIVSGDHPTETARRPELERFAAEHGLAVVSVPDITAYRRTMEPQVLRGHSTVVRNSYGRFTAVNYQDRNGREHVALVAGSPAELRPDTPVYVHRDTAFAPEATSRLHRAFTEFGRQGSGIVLHLHDGYSPGAGAVIDSASAGAYRSIEQWILEDLGVPATPFSPSGTQALGRTA